MTAASNAFQTMTRLTAVQLEVDGDSDEDSVMSSQHYADTDEDDESIDALIERYAGKRPQLSDAISSDEDESSRNTTFTDKDNDDNDADDKVISKPIVRLKEQQFEAPEFDQRLQGYNEASAGESVTFVAQFRAHPAPTVKWFKDEQEVRATERHLLESSSSDCVGIIRLIINDVRTTDEGAYKCKVENQEGVASTTGYLSVSGDESRSRSRTAARTTSSRSGKLSPGSTISSPSRSPGVSTPPVLRPIAEQKSIEEKEELELSRQPPSPLQAFIDSIRHSAKSRHPPIFYGCGQLFGTVDDEIGDDDEYDVFDSEEDSVSPTTSIDCLEQLLAISPTSTGDDVEVGESPTTVMSTSGAPLADFSDTVTTSTTKELSKSVAEAVDRTSTASYSFLQPDAALNSRDHLSFTVSTGVQDSPAPSTISPTSWLKTTELESNSRSSSTFHQRRLGQLQLKHRLAIDLPDVQSSMTMLPTVSSDETWASHSSSEMVCDSGFSDSLPSSPTISSCSANLSTDSNGRIAIGNVFRVVQDSILNLFEDPVAQFYLVFVAVTSALANTFKVQPPWLVLIVTVVSFVSFQLCGRHRHHNNRQHDENILYTHCSALNTNQQYIQYPCSVMTDLNNELHILPSEVKY